MGQFAKNWDIATTGACLPTKTLQKPMKTEKKWSWGSADVLFGNQDLGFNDPFQIGFSTAKLLARL